MDSNFESKKTWLCRLGLSAEIFTVLLAWWVKEFIQKISVFCGSVMNLAYVKTRIVNQIYNIQPDTLDRALQIVAENRENHVETYFSWFWIFLRMLN